MNKWLFCPLFLIVTLGLTFGLQPARANHKLATVYVSPVIGHWMAYHSSNFLDDGPIWGLRAGFDFTSFIGLEGFIMRGRTEISPNDLPGSVKNDALYDAYGGGARINLPFGSVVPFLSVSIGQANMRLAYAMNDIDGMPVEVEKNERRHLVVFGAGLEYFVHRNVGLRFEAYDHYLESDFVEKDPSGEHKTHNWELGAGVTILFGNVPKRIKDADGDGVPDGIDHCPGTPPGVEVYDNGCALDSDRDGVPDYMDRCPDTSPSEMVDRQGCPMQQKAVTPPVAVADTDGDGVLDNEDLESNTIRGAVVDASGRAVDSDIDGVPDGIDHCPDTPATLPVDVRGCPFFEPEDFNIKLFFDFSKTAVMAKFFTALTRIVVQMKQAPRVELEIAGFTDQVGSAKANQALARKRATAVRDYLISLGVQERRLSITTGGKYPVDTMGEVPANEQRCVVLRFKQ